MLCKSLEDNARKKDAPRHIPISTREDCEESKLDMIVGPDGHTTCPETSKQRDSGRRVVIVTKPAMP